MFSKITSRRMQERIDVLKQSDASVETLFYILGPDRFLEWAHSVGVATYEGLRDCAPPIPPQELRSVVAASSAQVYLWSGLIDARDTLELYRHYAKQGSAPDRILDFGCGCGRMTRFLGAVPDLDVFGTDVNDLLVDWCKPNLRQVQTGRNGIMPPLSYRDGSFDCMYSLSIFTHLPEDAATAWVREVGRVLAPGGIALLTTHGSTAMETIRGSKIHQDMFLLTPEAMSCIEADVERDGFRHIRYDDEALKSANAGEDYGNVFMSEAYIRRKWTEDGLLEVVDYLPGGVRGWQDVAVLRRRSA